MSSNFNKSVIAQYFWRKSIGYCKSQLNFSLAFFLSKFHIILVSPRALISLMRRKNGLKGQQASALFLDCDGTLYPDGITVANVQKNDLNRDILSLIKSAKEQNSLIVLVTNQTSLARLSSVSGWNVVNVWRSIRRVAKFTGADMVFCCLHHRHANAVALRRKCNYHKPASKASRDFFRLSRIRPNNCRMVGDRISDIWFSNSSGFAHSILIYNPRMFEMNTAMAQSHELVPLEFEVFEVPS